MSKFSRAIGRAETIREAVALTVGFASIHRYLNGIDNEKQANEAVDILTEHIEYLIEEKFSMKKSEEPDTSDGALQSALATLLNRYSVENVSNTPDFILAQYVLDSLKAFNEATSKRSDWYGGTDNIQYSPPTEDSGAYFDGETSAEADWGEVSVLDAKTLPPGVTINIITNSSEAKIEEVQTPPYGHGHGLFV